MKYGLLQELYDLTEYIFGQNKVPYIYFNESGDWEPWLPKYECQADNYETNGCSVWGTQNQIETFHKFLYDSEPNYSERFTYNLTPVNREKGADPQKVYECIRKYGLVDNKDFPTPKDEEEFHDISEITGSLLAKGQYWLSRHELKHEWLWDYQPKDRLAVMKDALKTSPLACTVTAWYRNEEGKYYDKMIKNNHWVMVYRIDDEGIHVFDSYDLTKKVLTHDHFIGRCKRIFLNKKTMNGLLQQRSFLQMILDKLLFRKSLLEYIEDHIGTDVSPNDLAPDELGCAETVTTVLKQFDKQTPIILGTASLYEYLQHPSNGWVRSETPEIGCIIISPTGYGKKGTHGHVGFVVENDVIASNDSRTGKFIKNFTVNTWLSYFSGMSYPTFYFIKK